MRILILAPNYRNRVNWGHQLWRDEIARQHDVVFHGSGFALSGYVDVRKLVTEKGPFDVITVGENPRHFRHYEHLHQCEALKVCFVGDYFAAKEIEYNRLMRKHRIDIAFLPSLGSLYRFREESGVAFYTRGYWLPWHVDTGRYWHKVLEKKYDVACILGLFSSVYPRRPELQNIVRELPYRTLIGNWKVGPKREKYIDAINQSKIFVSVNGIYNEVTMKYAEVLACGTLFMTNKPNDADELGFEDGVNMVFYKDFNDMRNKIDWYLKHEDELQAIAKNGCRLVHEKYSNKKGVEKWSSTVKNELRRL